MPESLFVVDGGLEKEKQQTSYPGCVRQKALSGSPWMIRLSGSTEAWIFLSEQSSLSPIR